MGFLEKKANRIISYYKNSTLINNIPILETYIEILSGVDISSMDEKLARKMIKIAKLIESFILERKIEYFKLNNINLKKYSNDYSFKQAPSYRIPEVDNDKIREIIEEFQKSNDLTSLITPHYKTDYSTMVKDVLKYLKFR